MSDQLAIGFDDITRGAILSPDLRYRYHLHRSWGSGPRVGFAMLNPSKADSDIDDPTIVRCMGFARRWGYDGIEVVNRFALRATDPDQLMDYSSVDAFGPDNDKWLKTMGALPLVIAAWGSHRAVRHAPLLPDIEWHCLAINTDGQPKHPLYIRGDAMPIRWSNQDDTR
jgi:hypothetical protein